MSIKKPINILGAGPAGLSAAITLAKAGCEVHLHDRYDTTGKRFKGDLQGIENWSSKEDVLQQFSKFGLDLPFPVTPFYEVTLTDGKTTSLERSPEPLFYLVKRGPYANSLDTALTKYALAHGVHMHYRSSPTPSLMDIIATGPIRRSVIAADKGLTFRTNLPDMAIGIFHDDLAFLGYSYLLVAQGDACVCTVVFKELSRLNTCFEKTLKMVRRMVSINLDEAQPVGGVGSFVIDHPTETESQLLVGEAAGFQDFLWGFGIRTALTSGHLAAKSLLNNQNYSSIIAETLKPLCQASLVNRYMWETFKWNSKPLLPSLLKFPTSVRFNFRMLYRFTPFHRLLYPLALRYIKRHYPHSVDGLT